MIEHYNNNYKNIGGNNEKKVGIVTLHGYFNYGNKLQNYALKYILEKMGNSVTTTVVENKNVPTSAKTIIKNIVKKIINNKIVRDIIKDSNNDKRTNIFKEFSRKYLNEEFYEVENKNDLKELNKFDYFITGSDQVWNPRYYSKLPIYFLTFVSPKKRLSYAPSISVNELPEVYIEDYKNWLMNMSAISVREKAGARIIKKITGIEAPVLVDPTMLLNRDEWLEIARPAINRPTTEYILTYFLGGPTGETKEKIEKLAKQKNMKIINLGLKHEKETYETGPAEFLDYINNANAFFTDSFHGVVFSIIMQTPFLVYERVSAEASMYSRIETILESFGLSEREAKNFEGNYFTTNFSKSDSVLKKEREKALKYLTSIL